MHIYVQLTFSKVRLKEYCQFTGMNWIYWYSSRASRYHKNRRSTKSHGGPSGPWEAGVLGVLQHPLEKLWGCIAPPGIVVSIATAPLIEGEAFFFFLLVSSAQHPQSKNRSQDPGVLQGTRSVEYMCRAQIQEALDASRARSERQAQEKGKKEFRYGVSKFRYSINIWIHIRRKFGYGSYAASASRW